MRKLLYIIGFSILAIALCCFIFQTEDYNFFNQLDKISHVEFPNPLTNFTDNTSKIEAIDIVAKSFKWSFDYVEVNNPADFFNNVGRFFSGLGNGLYQLWDLLVTILQLMWEILIDPIKIIKDLITDLIAIFKVVLLFLGFNI